MAGLSPHESGSLGVGVGACATRRAMPSSYQSVWVVGGHLRKEAGRAKLAAIVGKARILLLSRTLPAPRDLPSQFIRQRVERPRSH